MEWFAVKLLQKDLYKTGTYKADSQKAKTFFMYEMKILP